MTEENQVEIEKRFFAANDQAAAMAYLEAIQTHEDAAGAAIYTNIPEGATLPDGYEIGVVPVGTRNAKEGDAKYQALLVTAVPTIDMVAESEHGASFLTDLVQRAFVTSCTNTYQALKAGRIASFPFNLDDFITQKSRAALMATYKEMAPAILRVLKEGGLTNLTQSTMRECFESAALASAYYPAMTKEHWERTLKMCIGFAEKKNLDAAIFKHWLETRDQIAEAGDFVLDIDNLEGAFAS